MDKKIGPQDILRAYLVLEIRSSYLVLMPSFLAMSSGIAER